MWVLEGVLSVPVSQASWEPCLQAVTRILPLFHCSGVRTVDVNHSFVEGLATCAH